MTILITQFSLLDLLDFVDEKYGLGTVYSPNIA